MFMIVNSSPTFGSRDEITGTRTRQFHAYVFETEAMAFKICDRLTAKYGRVEGFADDVDLSVVDAKTWETIQHPSLRSAYVPAPCNDNDMPF